jgi:hypothetical protein
MAGAILTAIIRWRGLRLPKDATTWRRILLQACLNSVVPFTLIAWVEQTTDAGMSTILNSTSPICVFLLTAFITRHEPITGCKLFGVGAGLAGTCLHDLFPTGVDTRFGRHNGASLLAGADRRDDRCPGPRRAPDPDGRVRPIIQAA